MKDQGIYDLDEMIVPVNHIFDLQEVALMKGDERRVLRLELNSEVWVYMDPLLCNFLKE